MAFSQNSQASDEWEDWFATELKTALGTNYYSSQPCASSTAANKFQETSVQHVEAAGSPFIDRVSSDDEGNDAAVVGVVQYEKPQVVRPWPAGTGVGFHGQDDNFHSANMATVWPYTVPHIPVLAVIHPQQPSGMISPGTHPIWMGREYGMDGSVLVANEGTIPVLRYHGRSNFQPSRVVQAPVPINNGQNLLSPGLAQNYSHLSGNDVAGVPDPFSSFQVSTGMQSPGGSEGLNSSQPSVRHGSHENLRLLFGTTTKTPASLRASLPPASIMRQSPVVTRVTAFNTGTTSLTNPPPTRSSTTGGGGHGRGSKGFQNYPPRSQPLPVGLSRRQICRSYPNHLHGDTLLRVVHGSGREKGLWTGKDVWDECPADGRNYAINSRPHNYLEQRIRRAEIEASGSSQAARRPERTRRSRDDTNSNGDVEEGQMNPSSKRLGPTHVSDGNFHLGPQPALLNMVPYNHHSPQMPQVLQNLGNISVNSGASRAAPHSPEEDASGQNHRDSQISNIRPSQFAQPDRATHIGIPWSILAQAQETRLPAPAVDNTNIAEEGQSVPQSGIAPFNAEFRAEVRFQHQIIWERLSLHPQASAWSEDVKLASITKTWMDRYRQWERSIERKYGMRTEKTPQSGTDPLGLLLKAYLKDAPPSGLLDRESYKRYMEKARNLSMWRFLDDLRWWRSDFASMFADDLPVDNPITAPAVEHQQVPIVTTATSIGNSLSQLLTDPPVSSSEIRDN